MLQTFSTLKTYVTFLLPFLFTKLSQSGVSQRVSVTVSMFISPLIEMTQYFGNKTFTFPPSRRRLSSGSLRRSMQD